MKLILSVGMAVAAVTLAPAIGSATAASSAQVTPACHTFPVPLPPFLPCTPSLDAAAVTQCSTAYFDGDPRLGPERLPAPIVSEVGTQVILYQRTGAEPAQQFLTEYYDPAANGGKGGWRYPPSNGYVIDSHGQPVEAPHTLPVGHLIDRYGSEFGAFLAPQGTPYAERSIPPQSLDTSDPAYTCNYHRYRVIKEFTVEAGPIAPWFKQRGGGEQYQVDGALLPGAPNRPNVMWLIGSGYLQRLN
jgi:Tuberculosis necrotizing toxin